MIVSLIVAMEQSGGIGKQGQIPWRLPDDLKLFKQITMGHHLVVGRVTYESIGRALPGRHMLVVTRQPDYPAPGCVVVHSLEEALAVARHAGEEEVFIGGGAQIYQQALPLALRLYLTRVHAKVASDAFFPPIDEEQWLALTSREFPADERNQYAFTHSLLTRK